MEGLTRLVSESLARHGFDRPLDYRHLRWSRWFRCESHHSLLFVPSQAGVFAIAEEVMDLGVSLNSGSENNYLGSAALGARAGQTPAAASSTVAPDGRKRMLAVTQFFEDDDMAFVLDRMLSRENPMRLRLLSGRYFVRFVVIEDQAQRHGICNALNQWMLSSAEKATGIGQHFASSLELTPANEHIPPSDERQQTLFNEKVSAASSAHVATASSEACPEPGPRVLRSAASASSTNLSLSHSISTSTTPHLQSGAATNIHCPSPLPSGF